MRINHKILSIPPYISTAWKNIASVHAEEREGLPLLVITLHTGFQIEVPGLQPFMIEAIFTAHAAYMEQEQLRPIPQRPIPDPVASQNESTSFSFPVLKIGVNGVDHLNGFMQHNLEQSDSPDLPSELLNKIATIAKAIGFDSNTTFPEPEPHCNCPHCQIARTIKTAASDHISEMDEEPVSDEDLKFRTWDIHQSTDKVYLVSNPLDEKEQYSVFLGNPVGCTCGQNNCEHIRAVLNS